MARTSLFSLFGALASTLDEAAHRAPAQARAVAAAPIGRAWWLLGRAFRNALLGKLVLVPVLLAIYALLPPPSLFGSDDGGMSQLTLGLLCLCGMYQSYESLEWLARSWRRPAADPGAEDDARIAGLLKGAMRTDVVVSIQCIAVTGLLLSSAPFAIRALGVALVAAALTLAMYAPIAAIVLLADLGLRVHGTGGRIAAPGRVLLALAPRLLRGLALLAVAVSLVFGAASAVYAGHALLFPSPSQGVID
ncbi:DUF808 family protein [Xanthomonas sp. A2111]|uniref:DUF808 family protein n=1 Tax=Xanthomonas hawaiiensis TaxID=3003247 RepID=A0ABU2I6G2_9XANT|nr:MULTISPECIES: DUF808 family protein [unclassified Xanthomonas]MBO9829502.1 DUF808 family protein [Xanthomonas sp. A2111]MBO9875323.1 DUF808 family protein [Xanthomonas sp. D-93]MDS9993735.1 DUF808 family protein [Xanthomonas sp. A2111]WNH45472.1 DUF808 family protein [Xanthomonas sp. A6251]